MATLMQWGNSEGIKGRCDAKCHNAKGAACHCMCGGRYHGGAAVGDLAERVEAYTDEVLDGAIKRCAAEGLLLRVPNAAGKLVAAAGDRPLLDLADDDPDAKRERRRALLAALSRPPRRKSAAAVAP